jgi:hypothetical protein
MAGSNARMYAGYIRRLGLLKSEPPGREAPARAAALIMIIRAIIMPVIARPGDDSDHGHWQAEPDSAMMIVTFAVTNKSSGTVRCHCQTVTVTVTVTQALQGTGKFSKPPSPGSTRSPT